MPKILLIKIVNLIVLIVNNYASRQKTLMNSWNCILYHKWKLKYQNKAANIEVVTSGKKITNTYWRKNNLIERKTIWLEINKRRN